eukprot:2174227-Pyramimonas_sp.AAC.1
MKQVRWQALEASSVGKVFTVDEKRFHSKQRPGAGGQHEKLSIGRYTNVHFSFDVCIGSYPCREGARSASWAGSPRSRDGDLCNNMPQRW